MNVKQKRIFEFLDTILWEDWDPIGVNQFEEARDEYQGYAHHLVSLLIAGADKAKIAAHLYGIETINMGMAGDKSRCEAVAEKIVLGRE